MRPTLVLFDIDGTLISAGGAGRRAIVRLFVERWGRPDAFVSVPFAGMTDLSIFRAGLRAIGRPDDAATVRTLIDPYLAILREEVRGADGYRLHHGIGEILDSLEQRRGVLLGLGTGNVEAGARIKLEHVRVYHRFRFGGFGSDHEQRAELLRVGVERGARLLGRRPEECRVLVIGDTPRDIEAARAIGAACVAVATGPFDREALSAHDPEEVVERVLDSRLLRELDEH